MSQATRILVTIAIAAATAGGASAPAFADTHITATPNDTHITATP
ncbi:hypothetical protein [Streptomyces sp. NPDC001292]